MNYIIEMFSEIDKGTTIELFIASLTAVIAFVALCISRLQIHSSNKQVLFERRLELYFQLEVYILSVQTFFSTTTHMINDSSIQALAINLKEDMYNSNFLVNIKYYFDDADIYWKIVNTEKKMSQLSPSQKKIVENHRKSVRDFISQEEKVNNAKLRVELLFPKKVSLPIIDFLTTYRKLLSALNEYYKNSGKSEFANNTLLSTVKELEKKSESLSKLGIFDKLKSTASYKKL